MAKFSKLGSINSKFQGCINSRWLLYIIFFLSASDLYIFAVNGELFYVALFVLIGFLTTFFSKNMTVILLMAMTLTNILRFGKDVRMKEGMEDGTDATTKDADEEGGDHQFLDGETDETKKTKKTVGGSDSDTAKEPLIESIVTESKEPVAASPAASKSTPSASTAATEITPDIISSKIEGLDQDTLNLLKKQQKLMENMQNLEPLIGNANKLLEKFKNIPSV